MIGFGQGDGVLEISLWDEAFGLLFSLDRSMGPGWVPRVPEILNEFLPILLCSFVVTLVTVPLARWVAVKLEIVDRPDGARKIHQYPIAYLGGAAVFCGVLSGIIGFDLFGAGYGVLGVFYSPVPYAVVFGLIAIFATGLLDDIFHWDPRLKLAGQLAAAAGLAVTDIGTNAAEGVFLPLVQWMGIDDLTHLAFAGGGRSLHVWNFWSAEIQMNSYAGFIPWMTLEGVYYWFGVAFIGAMVLGASNSANLIDGLDGLLAGSVAIMAIGFTVVAVILAQVDAKDALERNAYGQELVTTFVGSDWSSPASVNKLDFTGDGVVDFDDWDWMLEPRGEPVSSAVASGWLEKWNRDANPGDGDEVEWPVRFNGQRDVLVAFEVEPAADGGQRFDLVKVPSAPVGGSSGDSAWDSNAAFPSGGDSAGAVDRADLRFWLMQNGVLSEDRSDRDPLAGTRLIIALALLGACLGFLPYNFNPAVIFLGDAGSLMLGFLCAVLILSLGSEGQTHYVLAGLIIFALPIMDTVLAIVRRKLAGLPMSAPDKNHIHHMMLRGTSGNVKKAVLCLYGLNAAFVAVGVGLAATVALGGARYLLAYGVAILIFGFVGAVAIKTALRHRWALQLDSEAAED